MEPVKLKAVLSAAILASGMMLVLVIGTGAAATAYQADGLAIDFGEREVVWTDADLHAVNDPIELLIFACNENRFDYEVIGGEVIEIRDVRSDTEREWGFWVIDKGSIEWRKVLPPYDLNLLNYTSCVWAFTGGSERPTVGADQSGNSIFGYPRPQRTVSLAPSITEIIGSLNAVSTLVGTDKYSNWPNSVVDGQIRGDITIVGDWQFPSYEMIMSTNPEMVFCDGSVYTHREMSESLRRSDVPTVVMYSGESIETILDNIYIIGLVIQYDMRALSVISQLETAQNEMTSLIQDTPGTVLVSTMLSLSSDKSPWVSGKYTYADDVLNMTFGINAMPSNFLGWVHVSSEIIAFSNPSVIIILSSDYRATQAEYDLMIASLSAEWRHTDAYDPDNMQIYLFCDDLAELALRAGPRYAQLMEIMAMILHPEAFDTELPKFIGNEYESYLTFSKYLGFND
ncbi:MAG: helical backbone metal receptor [Methanomassiliicoccaceae archaeon]|nr:helical backbone metal receptor [Methanomassiliicoccaceae archaeon]